MASTDSIISISSIRKGSAHPCASRRTLQVTEKDNEWFIEIRDAFNPDLESDYEMPMPVCICLVPKPLVHVKPGAYTPQLIALGLYNHFQPELYEMEHYKLAAVKRAITPVFQLSVFENLIEEIVTQVPYICKCSRGLTAPNHDIISWIMAVDGLFLLDLLNTFTNRGEISQQSTGKKQPEAYTLLKGVLKLENQIPMFVLKMILEKIYYDFPGQLFQIDKNVRFSACSVVVGYGGTSATVAIATLHYPLVLEEI
ncbi:Uncharacterized protein TCM_032617 [Theobroma cacao]|uniref:Uncharacterized protein n=1 Tax=Theobroma cacao TaxID=3641 RepID=A0A061FA21_THECC|nr:Uncharacterized protein TCM_032617 [Theobroma cacao]